MWRIEWFTKLSVVIFKFFQKGNLKDERTCPNFLVMIMNLNFDFFEYLAGNSWPSSETRLMLGRPPLVISLHGSVAGRSQTLETMEGKNASGGRKTD